MDPTHAHTQESSPVLPPNHPIDQPQDPVCALPQDLVPPLVQDPVSDIPQDQPLTSTPTNDASSSRVPTGNATVLDLLQ